jgi:hypothetical protein
MGDEEAPVRTERAWFLSTGEESEVGTGADFLAGEISVLTIPRPSPFSIHTKPISLLFPPSGYCKMNLVKKKFIHELNEHEKTDNSHEK